MKTSSAKQKGRRLAVAVKEKLKEFAPDLQDGDFLVTSSGANGPDVVLSPRAQEIYPLAIECKNTEKLNVYDSIKQSQQHAIGTNLKPIVIFSRNHEPHPHVILKLEDFLWLIR